VASEACEQFHNLVSTVRYVAAVTNISSSSLCRLAVAQPMRVTQADLVCRSWQLVNGSFRRLKN